MAQVVKGPLNQEIKVYY